MEELFPLLVAAGYFLLRAMSSRAKKAQQEQRRKQRAEQPPSLPEQYDRSHPLPNADPSQETRLERETPGAQAPESLGDALKRISEALQAEFDPEPIPTPSPLPRQERLPTPPPLPSGGSTSNARPIPQARDLSRKAVSKARLERAGGIQSAEDRFEETGEVFRAVTKRPTKHAHVQQPSPSRVRFLRDKRRLREAIIAFEILGPPKSKGR